MPDLQHFIHQLDKIDQSLFVKFNSEWTNTAFDFVLPWMRNAPMWAPLYLFLVIFMLLNFKGKAAWWLLVFICTVALTDMIGNLGFKHNFERLRPCNNPVLLPHLRLLVNHCSSGFSFTSNHAANHFGMAAFFYYTLKNIFPKFRWLVFVWAGLIAYAQVYVGVHYPFDVIGGTALGLTIGCFMSLFFNRRFSISLQ